MRLRFLISLVFLAFSGEALAQTPDCGSCSTPPTRLQRQTSELQQLSEEMVRPVRRPRNLRTTSTTSTVNRGSITDRYLNSRGCFSRRRNAADSCAPSGWNAQSLEARAKYVHDKYVELLRVHKLDYSPRILTCKVMRESTFRPQDQAGTSTASGLSQVTKSTARDLFNRGRWFTPKVQGFEKIRSGDAYFDKMKTSTVAQLELGLAVLHQKSRDNRTSNVKSLLARYYGTNSSRQNNHYAQKIYDCAACIQRNGNTISESCLMRAKD